MKLSKAEQYLSEEPSNEIVLRVLRALSPDDRRSVLQEILIEERAKEEQQKIAAEIQRYREEDMLGTPARAERDRRIEADRLRSLADKQEILAQADAASAEAILKVARDIRARADAIDPPKPKAGRERKTLAIVSHSEHENGGSSWSSVIVVEPARETMELLNKALDEARSSSRQIDVAEIGRRRVAIRRSLLNNNLTGELHAKAFNCRDTPEGAIWAKALAMVEEYRDGQYPFG